MRVNRDFGSGLVKLRTLLTEHRIRLIYALPLIAALCLVSLLLGAYLDRVNITGKLRGLTSDSAGLPADGVVVWTPVGSELHQLEVARIPFRSAGSEGVLTGDGGGGGLAVVGDFVLFATGSGQLGYLSPDQTLNTLPLSVDMNWDGLAESELSQNPLFIVSWLRTHDVFASPRADGDIDVYVSHHRFAGECIDFLVSRTVMRAIGNELQLVSDGWETVYTAGPCVPMKDRGWLFNGHQAGGRIIQIDATRLGLTIGDHEFDGVNSSIAYPMDLASPLGKIVTIDLDTGDSRILSYGHRNPQGLVRTADGEIWSTEHGPRGGDEVNLIREGQNYGWPQVTMGVAYGYPAMDWPTNPVQGRHEGYVKPRLAFTPAVGISNLVEITGAEFPTWQGDLLVGTLKARALLRLRRDGDDILSTETIPIDERVRDLDVFADGKLAILADSGHLLLVRNADGPAEGEVLQIAGLQAAAPHFASRAQDRLPTMAPMERGRALYMSQCASCHSLAPENGIGPHLAGIIGREIGSAEGFGYSDALAAAGGVWTERQLTEYVLRPAQTFPGTTMPATGTPHAYADDVILFLRSR